VPPPRVFPVRLDVATFALMPSASFVEMQSPGCWFGSAVAVAMAALSKSVRVSVAWFGVM
jgi:hypothetical protein